jgi:GalNAc-alpha-(1->4)-GalNAc-alpha-(1->3)-diNAcBac-PP-undecaprenol alpha-1,4-N-acetyl-D-galactosaminyltransferase
MTHIAFVMGHLRMGGAERVVSGVASGLAERGHPVTLITFSRPQTKAYTISDKITEIALDMEQPAATPLHSAFNVSRRIWHLRQTLQQVNPACIITFTDRTNIMALLARRDIPIAISVTTSVTNTGWMIRRLRRLLYRRATLVTSNSRTLDRELTWIPADRRVIAYNPIITETIDAHDDPYPLPANRHYIVNLARLVPVKNHKLLLDAFAQVADDFPDWDVVFIGDGPEHERLVAQRDSLHLTDRVHLVGRLQPPFATLKRADLFVTTSYVEGMSNAMMEAMACGLPVITTDYDGDPRDLIQHGTNGLIVPSDDAPALATALRHLMTDPARRAEMGRAAAQVRQRFALATILDTWEAIIQRMTSPDDRRP